MPTPKVTLTVDDMTQELFSKAPRGLNWSALLRVNIAMAMMDDAGFLKYLDEKQDEREAFNYIRERLFKRPGITARGVASERAKYKSGK